MPGGGANGMAPLLMVEVAEHAMEMVHLTGGIGVAMPSEGCMGGNVGYANALMLIILPRYLWAEFSFSGTRCCSCLAKQPLIS